MSELLKEVLAEYARAHDEKQRRADEARERAEALLSGVRAPYEVIPSLAQKHLADVAGGAETSEEAKAALEKEIAAVRADYDRALREAGIDPSDLEPIWDCPLCRDTGYTDLPDGRRVVCDCVREALVRRSCRSALITLREGSCFENFDPGLFSGSPDERGTSPRERAEALRDLCSDFAEHFPDTKFRNLLLLGPSGLGKTFALECIARRVLERGGSVCALTAYKLSSIMQGAYFSNEESIRDREAVENADLLFIDDLGSEPLRRNIDLESLFSLFNERQIRNRHTLIASNLTLEEIRGRYGERILSRLMEKDVSRAIRLTGDNLWVTKPGKEQS